MPGDPVLIKKYSNRRLYDTRISRYITLEELATTIREGARVRVVDAKTDADLTRQVLMQVILEEQDRLKLLPPELLHHVIRAQGTLQAAPLADFLSRSFAAFTSAGSGATAGLSDLAEQTRRWTETMSTFGFGPLGAAGSPRSGASRSGGEAAAGDDLGDLRDRMDDLLSRLRGG